MARTFVVARSMAKPTTGSCQTSNSARKTVLFPTGPSLRLAFTARRNGRFRSGLVDDSRLLALLLILGAPSLGYSDSVDFNRDIRPILSDKCYLCHGPDAGSREADLRLDVASESKEVIASGELLRRITSTDDYEQMPPPESNLTLDDREQELLRRWVEQGAEYQRHWAFEPLPERPEVPHVNNTAWTQSPLDHFVLARLEEASLGPTPAADPLRWLRRVTFDLTGLPPTPEEIAKFASAVRVDRASAMDEVVDRLLASPQFGEHMAVRWLDAARYADSYGYQSDQLNTQWPYRDWVVRMFNQNLPYDEFITWQLAGDLLENPTSDQLLGTAFNRLHRMTNEGGAVYEEWRIEGVADRVHTFGTAVLGLTLECARCHDHKYDPVSQRDYYALSAFFNSIDESGVYDSTSKVPAPSLLLPTPEQEVALQQADSTLERAKSVYDEAKAIASHRFAGWRAERSPQRLEISDRVLAIDFDEPYAPSDDESWYPATDHKDRTQPLPQVEVSDSSLPRLQQSDAARRAVVLDGNRGIRTKGVPRVDRWTPFTLVLSFRETKRLPEHAVLAHHCGGTDVGYNGWDLTIENGFVESRLYRVWPGNAIGIRTTEPIPANVWHQLAATYDGSSTAEGLKLYLNGEPLPVEILRNRIHKSANIDAGFGGELVIGQRFRSRGLDGGLVDDVQFYSRALQRCELRQLAGAADVDPSLEYYLSAVDPECRIAAQEVADAWRSYVMAEEAVHEIPIMREMPDPRPTHVLARGQYDAPVNEQTLVSRVTPESIGPPFPGGAPQNRLGLAAWATDDRNPLTARVFVNRLWANFFGTGLVATTEDFGLQGELPTHPELLDWLARDFVDSGWDVKRLAKVIVLSATYQQDSVATPEKLSVDPQNRLLSRGPAHRLSAEQIRDLSLAASGLLEKSIGGPPVSPYQAGGDLWREANAMSPAYRQSVGQALYRRSVYSVWKRTAPLPNMLAFDAPTREVCVVRRSRTNTPLQALVLLNDVQFVEAARVLADQLLRVHDSPDSRLTGAFVALTGRSPTEREQVALLELLHDEQAYYAMHLDEATKLVSVGEQPRTADLDLAELAALTTTCQAILNLDATIWKR